jgi:hypothetical protein
LSVAGAKMLAADFRSGHRDPIAGAAIGRRGLGLAIRHRPAGPHRGQWTVAGTPPARPDRHRRHDGRHGSSGPPAARDAHRSTGEHPPAAAKTVRAATEQNSLLLTHQERYGPGG